MEEIGQLAFALCASLRGIVIPNAVKAIKEGAFSNCTGLTSVTLGNGLEEIGEEAFNECTSLERIMIPRNVKSIHDTAFKDCSNLTSVRFCDEIERVLRCHAELVECGRARKVPEYVLPLDPIWHTGACFGSRPGKQLAGQHIRYDANHTYHRRRGHECALR